MKNEITTSRKQLVKIFEIWLTGFVNQKYKNTTKKSIKSKGVNFHARDYADSLLRIRKQVIKGDKK